MKSLKIFFMLLAAVSYAGAQELNFDGRPGVKSLSVPELLSADAVEIPEAKVLKYAGVTNDWNPRRLCQNVDFYARDGKYASRKVGLTSTLTQTTCRDITGYDSNGNSFTYESCHVSMQWPYTTDIKLKMQGRELVGTESERIEVCYNFMSYDGLSVKVKSSPFEYRVRRILNSQMDYTVEFDHIKRVPRAPEASALSLEGLSYDDMSGEFTLRLTNNFGEQYYGGKVVVAAELMEDRFFDSSKGTKLYEFQINRYPSSLVMKFKASDFGADKDADFRAKAKRYYVKWGFKVKKDGFTEDYIEKGKSGTVSVIR